MDPVDLKAMSQLSRPMRELGRPLDPMRDVMAHNVVPLVPIPPSLLTRAVELALNIRRCRHHDWELLHGDRINRVGCRYLCRRCPAKATKV